MNAVAQNILQQLGGNRFALMTGAKNFVYGENMLQFKLPSNFARDGINAVRVTLTAMDDYSVEFFKVRGVASKPIAYRENVYCDTLQSTFKAVTGLDTRL
jgi:hypothetical protein